MIISVPLELSSGPCSSKPGRTGPDTSAVMPSASSHCLLPCLDSGLLRPTPSIPPPHSSGPLLATLPFALHLDSTVVLRRLLSSGLSEVGMAGISADTLCCTIASNFSMLSPTTPVAERRLFQLRDRCSGALMGPEAGASPPAACWLAGSSAAAVGAGMKLGRGGAAADSAAKRPAGDSTERLGMALKRPAKGSTWLLPQVLGVSEAQGLQEEAEGGSSAGCSWLSAVEGVSVPS